MLTQGSHFDGISAFPLAASRYGIKTLWATEIEPFPVAVSKHHFPGIKHYGDITKVSGYELEPVDIITFGSPCQDLSVAGKREGLYGERSGLFMEAIRTIREMREATNGKYPRFAIWENVPGAFSSNRGLDFKAVLEEIAESKIPMPASGKWATAGMVRGNGCSIAWRTMDAQYWGVPQRRRRIFLVADFAGQRAPEILFEPQSVPGDIEAGRKARQETAAGAGDGVKATGFRLVEFGGYVEDKTVSPILARDHKGATDLITLYDMTHADEVMRPVTPGLAPTLNARMGTGGNQVPVTLAVRTAQTSANGHGIAEEKAHTLDGAQGQAVCYDPKDLGRRPATFEDKSPTIKARCGTGGGNVPITFGMDLSQKAEGIGFKEELSTCIAPGTHPGHGNHALQNYAVRRLTPLECERLQGFPDGWTDIPGASDTARYKAIGNSIAVPCLEWIYSQLVEIMRKEQTA